ncbi:F-type H+-transporting ATPase subunit b [Anaerosolibacter carboniphilus]|uniref:ATP synthase subunit b n=1 Tax=Anaerosolibacter carboniphilus TaxID=1417629 RepID=A0A841KZJ7_9FIRM|nr:F0F1 ATP synthase subunit B [Anaerosolibacter carboniphilus]MBB6216342.1 F-type H+-transporting ATPase subunit b [Anaerosolibacter carboniphilus]
MVVKAGLVEIGWTLVFQLINTIIIFLILRKLLFKPVSEMMAGRQNAIAESIKEAENKNKEADQLKLEYQRKLEGAHAEGRELIKDASKRADARADEIIIQAQQEAMKIKDRAEADIQREKQKAANMMKEELAALAVMAAGKIIGKDLDEKGHDKLIKDFIDEVGETTWSN